MGDTRDRVGNAGVIVAGGAFKIALYVCIVVLIIWLGRLSYQFGHDIFDQQPMSPGEGQEITVVVKEDDSVYDIAKTLESKGLVEDAKVFWIQEKLSNYKGQMKPGTYLLSTAYEPSRLLAIMAGDAEQEGAYCDRRRENENLHQFSGYGKYRFSGKSGKGGSVIRSSHYPERDAELYKGASGCKKPERILRWGQP